MIQIVWKQKHQSGHGTCDKKILTPPSIRICPLFGELKKGDYFYPPPSHMDQCLLLSNFFFFECFPNLIKWKMETLPSHCFLCNFTTLH